MSGVKRVKVNKEVSINGVQAMIIAIQRHPACTRNLLAQVINSEYPDVWMDEEVLERLCRRTSIIQ